MFKDWDWDDTWSALGITVIVLGITFGALFAFAPKNVDYYYLSHGSGNQSQAATCVYAHWTWHTDEIAFCTDDNQKALDFAAKANMGLRGK